MQYSSLQEFSGRAGKALATKGPYAIALLEDEADVEATLVHLRSQGFSEIIVAGQADLLPVEAAEDADDPSAAWDAQHLHCVVHDMHEPDALSDVVNAVIAAAPGVWLHYCYNAEYLFYPFCEDRTVREMTIFCDEERRASVLTYVIDLYSNDLGQFPNAVSRETAHLDAAGYFALARKEEVEGPALDRQLDFFGGLRWRFEEHVPKDRRRIDRVSLFKARPGLKLRADHTFNVAEYNTYACPWHHNITAALCSFRTAKALMSNPGSKYAIPHFWWDNSTKFDWNSRQLLELGMMEPGQWF